MRGLLLALILALGLAPGHALAWWQKDWPFRKQITIDTTSKGVNLTQPVGRAPLLIRLHSGNFRFEDASENGQDLRFTASDDKTPLAYHIESFDPLLGVATVWVDIPEFPVGAQKSIWMYYGNKKSSPATDTPATFDPDYSLVYHFDAAAGAPPKDKTAYGNNSTSAPGAVDDGSIIGKGARFTGTGPVLVPASTSLATAAGGKFTFSAWVKSDGPQVKAALYARREGAAFLVVGLDQDAPFVESGGVRIASATPLAKGSWSHVAAVDDGANLTLYVNGKPAETAGLALPALNGQTALGGDAPGGAGYANFIGGMDEARVSKVARPPALIEADAASQGAESRMVAFAADEKQSGIGFGPLGIIVKSVDPVTWGVIIILMGMLALAVWVIWSKIAYVGAASRADGRFVRLFREAGEEPLALADEARVPEAERRRLGASPIYRVYRAGAAEIMQRQGRGLTVLRAEAVEVVRALMDATIVRENQRLSANLVWLTLAIAGGPFLGLLGTVIGVMITFAAIAAAGDVNVNAIAPGISAALLATVAGLAVAIPALFGYNYILLRNKNVSANMQVFGDEFLTRISEQFSHDEPRPPMTLAKHAAE